MAQLVKRLLRNPPSIRASERWKHRGWGFRCRLRGGRVGGFCQRGRVSGWVGSDFRNDSIVKLVEN